MCFLDEEEIDFDRITSRDIEKLFLAYGRARLVLYSHHKTEKTLLAPGQLDVFHKVLNKSIDEELDKMEDPFPEPD